MVRHQHVAPALRGSKNGASGGIEGQHHAGDLAFGIPDEQPSAVPFLGPLGRERAGYRALDVANGDTTHSGIDLQPPDPSGNAAAPYPAVTSAS